MPIFHIANRDAWERARTLGVYEPPSLAAEGFIHFSFERQVVATAERFYRGQTDLVLLAVPEERVSQHLKVEQADGDRFPHLYAPLPVSAVEAVAELATDADGAFAMPTRWQRFQ